MADTKKTDLGAIAASAVAWDDIWDLVDKSDTTMDAAGTNKRLTTLDIVTASRLLSTNFSATDQTPAASTDTYIAGSNVVIPTGHPVVGSMYRCQFRLSKTAAGTATPIIQIRTGSNGTTADTSRATLTFGAGTAAVDFVLITVMAIFTSIHASTGSFEALASAPGQSTVGFANSGNGNGRTPTATAAGFNTAGLGGLNIGLSYNSGTSGAHTISLVRAEYIP